MRMIYALALFSAVPLLAAPAMAEPPDQTEIVAQAMQQAAAMTDATRADAAKTDDRLSQAPTQALYDHYHQGGAAAATAQKPCNHPAPREARGLCVPPLNPELSPAGKPNP